MTYPLSIGANSLLDAGARPAATVAASRRARLMALLALYLFSALVGRLVYLGRPFDSDGAIFAYQGKMTYEGGRLTHDLIDNKLPTVGLMTSAAWRAFGANWAGYVLLGATLTMATCWMLGELARRTFGQSAGVPALLFALVYLNLNTVVFGGFQLETPQCFFGTVAAWFFVIALARGSASAAFTGALAVGCAAMFKPTGLAVVGAFGIAWASEYMSAFLPRGGGVSPPSSLSKPYGGGTPPPRAGVLLAVAVGLAVTTSVVAAYLSAAHLWSDMPPLLRQLRTYSSQSVWNVTDVLKIVIVAVVGGFPLVVRGWVFRRDAEHAGVATPWAVRVFVLAWLGLELGGIVMQRRMYAYHFLPLVPPLALAYGMIPRRVRVGPLLAGLLPTAVGSVLGAATVFGITYTGRQTLMASDYLVAHASPGDRVWRDDYPRLLIETGLKPGSRVPLAFLFANSDEAPQQFGAMILEDFERLRPRWVVLPADVGAYVRHQRRYIWELEQRPVRGENYAKAWEAIRDYTVREYAPVARVGDEVVYERRQPRPSSDSGERPFGSSQTGMSVPPDEIDAPGECIDAHRTGAVRSKR